MRYSILSFSRRLHPDGGLLARPADGQEASDSVPPRVLPSDGQREAGSCFQASLASDLTFQTAVFLPDLRTGKKHRTACPLGYCHPMVRERPGHAFKLAWRLTRPLSDRRLGCYARYSFMMSPNSFISWGFRSFSQFSSDCSSLCRSLLAAICSRLCFK